RSNLLFTVEDNEDETGFYGPNNVLLADEVYKIRHSRISGFTKIWLDTLEAINYRMPTDRGAIAFYICANAAKYAAYAYILADVVILRGQKLIIWYVIDIDDTDVKLIRGNIIEGQLIKLDVNRLSSRSNKQYLADLIRTDYANAIIQPTKVIFNYALGGRDARRSAYKLNDIADKANKPGDRIRGAKEVEGAVEVKKLEAATF
ncbi:hypothetical protein Tdes44962_MAKER10519, partial [Teratosphaeria destructans]